jgi:hypothetical protein
MLIFIGASTFVFIFGGMLWTTARRWRSLAAHYARETPFAIEKRIMQSVILTSASGYNAHKGIITIGLHETGLSMRVMKPFSLFHQPLFIPYADIHSGPTIWYLNAHSIELAFRQEPDIRLVMSADQVSWINAASPQKFTVETRSSQRQSPTTRWHAFATVHAAIALVMVVCLLLQLPQLIDL